MQEQSKDKPMDFKQSLFASYANIAIMEMSLYNSSDNFLRPSHKEMLYIYCIWSHPGCTASDLVEMFSSSKALVSQTILSMQEKGYITREKDPDDNRRQILRLSDQRLLESTQELEIIDKASKVLASKYTPEQIEEASRIICDFTEEMRHLATKSRFH